MLVLRNEAYPISQRSDSECAWLIHAWPA